MNKNYRLCAYYFIRYSMTYTFSVGIERYYRSVTNMTRFFFLRKNVFISTNIFWDMAISHILLPVLVLARVRPAVLDIYIGNRNIGASGFSSFNDANTHRERSFIEIRQTTPDGDDTEGEEGGGGRNNKKYGLFHRKQLLLTPQQFKTSSTHHKTASTKRRAKDKRGVCPRGFYIDLAGYRFRLFGCFNTTGMFRNEWPKRITNPSVRRDVVSIGLIRWILLIFIKLKSSKWLKIKNKKNI